ncbi:MAG: hypothetical protein C0405_10000 [Desulfovibrio sp.]|nr:hypothetical protein [Desulfovibrio sp.]
MSYAEACAAAVVGRLGGPFAYYPPESLTPAPLASGAKAIWHEAHQVVKETRSGAPITSTAPAMRVLKAHFPAGEPQQGGVVELAAGRFTIADIHELGGGALLCLLHRANP